jgi:hypothetical protein
VLGATASAQFSDPRKYQNFPVGVNQIEVTYAYVRANSSLDPSLVIADAKLHLNQGAVSYTRYFSFFRRMAWITPTLPMAGINGTISGTKLNGSTAGLGDSSFEFAVLVKGGRALRPEEFANYKPTTSVGIDVAVTAPTGSYSADKILNLGADRWAFRPEIAVSYPFGREQKWTLDGYANSYFYTDNTSYHGAQILRQEPLPAIEGHLSYTFLESLSASLDTRYSFRGDTVVNGVSQNNSQNNLILGTEVIFSPNARHSITVVLEKAAVHKNSPSVSGVSLRYDYFWGRGYK